jgi:hypothetical protein
MLLTQYLEDHTGIPQSTLQPLIACFHHYEVDTVEELYRTSAELRNKVLEESDLLLEEWEAIAIFRLFERIKTKVVVSYHLSNSFSCFIIDIFFNSHFGLRKLMIYLLLMIMR